MVAPVVEEAAPWVVLGLRKVQAELINGGLGDLPPVVRELLQDCSAMAATSAPSKRGSPSGSDLTLNVDLTGSPACAPGRPGQSLGLSPLGTRKARAKIGDGNISDRGVRDLFERGTIPAEKHGKRWVTTNAAVEAYIRKRRTPR